ncbi:hypothetical protein NFJ02_29g68590 [Pycnococcus provasolii]
MCQILSYDTRIASSAVTTNESRLARAGLPLSHDGRDDKSTLLDMYELTVHEKERADKGDARPVALLHWRLCVSNTSPQLRRMLGVFRGDLAEGDANIKGGRAQGALSTPSRQFANWGYSSDKGGIQKDRARTYLDGFGMMNITDENYANHCAVVHEQIRSRHVSSTRALNVKREENIETSPTSDYVVNQPSSSVRSFDVTQPAACLPFFNISINDVHDRKNHISIIDRR